MQHSCTNRQLFKGGDSLTDLKNAILSLPDPEGHIPELTSDRNKRKVYKKIHRALRQIRATHQHGTDSHKSAIDLSTRLTVQFFANVEHIRVVRFKMGRVKFLRFVEDQTGLTFTTTFYIKILRGERIPSFTYYCIWATYLQIDLIKAFTSNFRDIPEDQWR